MPPRPSHPAWSRQAYPTVLRRLAVLAVQQNSRRSAAARRRQAAVGRKRQCALCWLTAFSLCSGRSARTSVCQQMADCRPVRLRAWSDRHGGGMLIGTVPDFGSFRGAGTRHSERLVRSGIRAIAHQTTVRPDDGVS
jgi:hypothetical protein